MDGFVRAAREAGMQRVVLLSSAAVGRPGNEASPVAANAILTVWAAGVGQAAQVSTLMPELTGKPARTFDQWAEDHAADFRAEA